MDVVEALFAGLCFGAAAQLAIHVTSAVWRWWWEKETPTDFEALEDRVSQLETREREFAYSRAAAAWKGSDDGR